MAQARTQQDVLRAILTLAQSAALRGRLVDAGCERPLAVIMRHSTAPVLKDLARRALILLDKAPSRHDTS